LLTAWWYRRVSRTRAATLPERNVESIAPVAVVERDRPA